MLIHVYLIAFCFIPKIKKALRFLGGVIRNAEKERYLLTVQEDLNKIPKNKNYILHLV